MTWQTLYTVLGALVAAGVIARALGRVAAAIYRRARALEKLAETVAGMLSDHEDRITNLEEQTQWQTTPGPVMKRTAHAPRGPAGPRSGTR